MRQKSVTRGTGSEKLIRTNKGAQLIPTVTAGLVSLQAEARREKIVWKVKTMTKPVTYNRPTGAQKKLAKGVQTRGVDGVMLSPKLAEKHKAGIQTAMIIKRLAGCAMGNIEMSASQIAAAKVLLDKSIPSLKSTQLVVEDFEDDIDIEDNRDRLVKLSKKFGVTLPAGYFEDE